MSYKAISLFTGVGGLDFGFEAAGFETRIGVDIDPVACAVLRRNRDWPVVESPIERLGSDELLEIARLKKGEADVLFGGPPCQPFSKSGYWKRGDSARLRDPRADTISQYLRVLRDTLPRTFLIENVPGLAFKGKAEGSDAIIRGIREINERSGTNYSVKSKTLNAASYGVPQSRERVFFVGSRDGKDFIFPTATHGIDGEPFRTSWDAFAPLPSQDSEELLLKGKWAGLLPSIPEGQNYLWHTERGGGRPLFGWRRRYWNFLLKLAKDRPSWTIQAQPGPATGPFHWDNRRLSGAELCALQTFPSGLELPPGLADVQRLIGNAVPSAMAEKLARCIAVQFLGGAYQDSDCTLVPVRAPSTPEPNSVRSVPRRYVELLGSDTPHPGTGRGRSAIVRSELAA